MTNTAQNILKTLGYFDLFQYPLTKDEIYLFHSDEIAVEIVFDAVEALVADKIIFCFDEFYTLRDDAALIPKRRKGNLLAIEQMKIAVKISSFLSGFPYVRGVAVSGSLSKNFATEKSDIDLFIVTEANRLWIARTLMHLYKKFTFLTGRQHWFCMNYYVDEAELEIPEKNIFTAMEIVTLLPMQGKSGLKDFSSINNWTKIFFPLHQHKENNNVPEIKKGLLRRSLEKILNNSGGDRLDKWLMKVTDRRWKKKAQQKRVNDNGGAMGMSVGRHFSKPDPKNFQEEILRRYQDKMQQIEDMAPLQNKITVPIL